MILLLIYLCPEDLLHCNILRAQLFCLGIIDILCWMIFFFLHEEVYVNFKISGRTLVLCCKYQWYHHLKL